MPVTCKSEKALERRRHSKKSAAELPARRSDRVLSQQALRHESLRQQPQIFSDFVVDLIVRLRARKKPRSFAANARSLDSRREFISRLSYS